MALFRALTASGGGGGFFPFEYVKTWDGITSFPTWNNTPITPNKVYIVTSGDSTHIPKLLTNVNPTTKVVDGNTYIKDGDGNWSASSVRTISTTSDSVTVLPNTSFTSTTQPCVYMIQA